MTNFAYKQGGRKGEATQYAVRLTGGEWEEVDRDTYTRLKEVDSEGALESLVQGFGNSVAQVGVGLGAIVSRGAEAVGGDPNATANMRGRLQEMQQTQDVRRGVNPLATITGEVAPDVGLGLVTGGTGGLARRTLSTAAVEGGLSGARSQSLEGAAIGAVAGAVGGGALPYVAPMTRKFVNASKEVVNGSRRAAGVEAPQALAAQGYRDPWYAGRGEVAQQVGATIESNPIANLATRAGKRAENNQTALNRTVAQDIYVRKPQGRDTPDAVVRAELEGLETVTPDGKLTPGFFEAVEQRFKDDYSDLASKVNKDVANSVVADPLLAGEVRDVVDGTFTSVVKNDQLDRIITRTMNRLDNKTADGKADQQLTAKALLALRSDLSRYATQQATTQTGDRAAAEAVSSVVSAIDDAMERALAKSGRPEVVDQWKDITKRYMLFKAAQEGRAVDLATGDVKARSLMNNLDKPRRQKAAADTDTLAAARHYVANATTGIPDSGTATRQLINTAIIGGTGYALAN